MCKIIAAGVFIVNRNNKLLICHPTNHKPNTWSIPKGKVEAMESYKDACVRETFEETNIDLSDYKDKLIMLDSVNYSHKRKMLIPFVLFENDCELLNLSLITIQCNSNVPEDRGGFLEMDDYKWVTIEEAKELLHETQVACLDKVKRLSSRKAAQLEEELLLERYLNGDNTAFSPLYYRYRGLVLFHLNKSFSYLSNEDIEDLAIDFLGRISGRLNLYDKEKSLFRTWMTKCILHFITEHKNKKSTREKDITDSITTYNSDNEYYDMYMISDDDTLKNVSYLNIIKLIKERLCDDDWKIFELHFLQGYNQAETGKRLGLREDTMWFRIKRIRKRLDGLQNL